jgi:hypothetical protein
MNARPHAGCLYPLLTFCLLVSGCEKDDETEEPAATAELAPIDGPATVVMKVNGTSVTLQAGSGTVEIIHTEVSGGPPPDTSSAVFLSGFHNGTDTLFRLRIGSLEFTGGVPTNAELLAFLAPGARSFQTIPAGGDGLEIEWRDGSGVRYGTSCGAISGSFEITNIASQQIGQEHYVKYRALFSGTLHACDGGGGSVSITDGVLVLRVNDDE